MANIFAKYVKFSFSWYQNFAHTTSDHRDRLTEKNEALEKRRLVDLLISRNCSSRRERSFGGVFGCYLTKTTCLR